MSKPAVFHPRENGLSYWTWEGKLVIADSILRSLMKEAGHSVGSLELVIESALAQWSGILQYRERSARFTKSPPSGEGVTSSTSPEFPTYTDAQGREHEEY